MTVSTVYVLPPVTQSNFTDDIIDVYREHTRISRFVHLPVQAGSDRILTMMKRGHTALEYKSIIRKLRAVRPNIQLAQIHCGLPR